MKKMQQHGNNAIANLMILHLNANKIRIISHRLHENIRIDARI